MFYKPINRYPHHIQDSVTPESLSYILGFFGTIIYCIWQIIYTLPRFDELIINEIITHNGNIIIIISAFIILIFINFIHAYCFFHLLGSVGATTTGMYIVYEYVLVYVCISVYISVYVYVCLHMSLCIHVRI